MLYLTNNLNVNVNVTSVFYNAGSGASCRLTDNVSSLLTGAKYKEAVDTYVKDKSAYANNAYHAFMQNGIIVMLNKFVLVMLMLHKLMVNTILLLQQLGIIIL